MFGLGYTALVAVTLAADFAASVSCWLAADHASSDYFIDHIAGFNFYTSVLDLVVLSLLRTGGSALLAYKIYQLIKRSVENNYGSVHAYVRQVRNLRLVWGGLVFLNVAYVLVKFVLVVREKWMGHSNERIGDLYFAVVCVALAFVLVETGLLAYNWRAMRQFRHYGILRINSGPERTDVEEKEEEEAKKQVEWKRLLVLAIPVSVNFEPNLVQITQSSLS